MFRALALVSMLLAASGGLLASPASRASEQGTATPVADHADMSTLTGTAAAFLVIGNSGDEEDVLLGGETEVANVVEVHEMADVDGVMEMRPLADGLTIPAGGEVTLEPGGYHLMLIGLREDLTNGKTYHLTLRFKRAGEITVPVMVRPRAEPAAHAMPAEPAISAGITITDPWSRPAPATGADAVATPGATPQA